MIKTLFSPHGDGYFKDVPLDQVATALKDPDNLVWVVLQKPEPDEIQQVMVNLFHFHPLAIEDCLSPGYQAPKVDDFSDYLFVIAHAVHTDLGRSILDTKELNSFLGPNFLVTSYLDEEMAPVDEIWKRLERDERLTHHGVDFLFHAILDHLVDEYMPVLDTLDEEIELLEDKVLARPQQATLTRILDLKHNTMVLRRIITPQREVMNRLSRDDFPQIKSPTRIYFRDIYDHLVRIHEFVEDVRDLISDALSTYLSATSNRLNEIMKALTIVSTIFLPLSFVAGNYGMNFRYMPEINWRLGYPMVILIYLIIAGGMLAYFRRRGWF